VYNKLDQPTKAIGTYKQGLEQLHASSLGMLVGLARVNEDLQQLDESAALYKEVLRQSSAHVEAAACLAAHHFYGDAPELAMSMYRCRSASRSESRRKKSNLHRRILQMGVYNADVFADLGLCCFHAQQFDLAMVCLLKALELAAPANQADVWYNTGHVALVTFKQKRHQLLVDYSLLLKASGDSEMAFQCFRLALAADPQHAEACCNLGVLEMRRGNDKAVRFNRLPHNKCRCEQLIPRRRASSPRPPAWPSRTSSRTSTRRCWPTR